MYLFFIVPKFKSSILKQVSKKDASEFFSTFCSWSISIMVVISLGSLNWLIVIHLFWEHKPLLGFWVLNFYLEQKQTVHFKSYWHDRIHKTRIYLLKILRLMFRAVLHVIKYIFYFSPISTQADQVHIAPNCKIKQLGATCLGPFCDK